MQMLPQDDKKKLKVIANWKSNGSVALIKDIINNMINKLDFDNNAIGKIY